jgi:hypothetical protein
MEKDNVDMKLSEEDQQYYKTVAEKRGYSVDWNVDEGYKILSEAPLRKANDSMGGYVEIFVNGNWAVLCRTDLMDNVATSSGYDSGSIEENRTNYLKRIGFGVRYQESTDKCCGKITRLFAVIDSLTDG